MNGHPDRRQMSTDQRALKFRSLEFALPPFCATFTPMNDALKGNAALVTGGSRGMPFYVKVAQPTNDLLTRNNLFITRIASALTDPAFGWKYAQAYAEHNQKLLPARFGSSFFADFGKMLFENAAGSGLVSVASRDLRKTPKALR